MRQVGTEGEGRMGQGQTEMVGRVDLQSKLYNLISVCEESVTWCEESVTWCEESVTWCEESVTWCEECVTWCEESVTWCEERAAVCLTWSSSSLDRKKKRANARRLVSR